MSSCQSSFSSESSDSNFELEMRRKSKSSRKYFQKNYPKNILISIITCLKLKGCENVYQQQGISQNEVQKKNSASLNDIHKILSHPLMKSFNKHELELLASNILLQNSKISKKAFHLEVIRDVFSFQETVSFTQFKNQMKKRAKKIGLKEITDCEIFKFQSSTIYLLNLFCKVLQAYPSLSLESMENRDSTEEEIVGFQTSPKLQKRQEKANRQLLKPLIQKVSFLLAKQRENKEKFEEIYDYIRQSILSTEVKIKQKLNLKQGVPSLRLFCPEVISKCFKLLENKQKLNFTCLSKWVKQFETRTLDDIMDSVQSVHAQIGTLFGKQLGKFQRESTVDFMDMKIQKAFSPIILTLPIENKEN